MLNLCYYIAVQEFRVAIFEDGFGPRSALKALLGTYDYEVIEAGSVEEADNLIKTLPPDAKIMALVDKNLTHNGQYSEDGQVIVDKLREKFGSTVRIASISGEETPLENVNSSFKKNQIDKIIDFVVGAEITA